MNIKCIYCSDLAVKCIEKKDDDRHGVILYKFSCYSFFLHCQDFIGFFEKSHIGDLKEILQDLNKNLIFSTYVPNFSRDMTSDLRTVIKGIIDGLLRNNHIFEAFYFRCPECTRKDSLEIKEIYSHHRKNVWEFVFKCTSCNEVVNTNVPERQFVYLSPYSEAMLGILVNIIKDLKAKPKKDTNFILNTEVLDLKSRIGMIETLPSVSNLNLAYEKMDEIVLLLLKLGKITLDEKLVTNVTKYDKLKNLAVGTQILAERKLAFERSVQIFHKISKVE